MRTTVACCLGFLLPLSAGAIPVSLTFGPSGLSVSGATPSGEVAWLGVSRVPRQYFQDVATVRRTVTADTTGTASLLLEAPAPRRSVWVAVDLASGAFSTGTPEDYALEEETLTSAQLAFDSQNQATQLVLAHQVAEVLLVRPTVGAWGLLASDAEAVDQDGDANLSLTLNLASLAPLGAAPPPASLQAGDVLVVLDPNRLTFLAATVSASLLTAGGN